MNPLLEKYIAKVGEMRKNYRCAACDGAKCQHTMCCNALSDIQSLLPELIKEVVEELRKSAIERVGYLGRDTEDEDDLIKCLQEALKEPNIK